MPDLLIELFSEEIPARMQAGGREALKKLVTDGLVEAGLTYAGAGAFSTPRRLVLAIEGLSAESRATVEERKGPSLSAPEQAIFGFMRSLGIEAPDDWLRERLGALRSGDVVTRDSDDLVIRAADVKGKSVLLASLPIPGRKAPQIVAEVLEAAIRNFPWPKAMRWGTGSLRWVRPLHSILCILHDEAGAQVVPLTVEGITTGNTTEGHRFMGIGRFTVSSFDDYAAKLRRAKVMLDPAEREAHIWQGAQNLAFAAGLEVVEDRGLLTEIAGLVEWPVPLLGRIPEAFLALPAEVLQTSMKEHQKFFSARNPKTGRIEGFVTVANIETPDDGATILKGNLKVLSARLSDARFFWENDLRVAKAGMGEWAEGLKAVTFHNKLGSLADRIARIAALALEIAPLVGADRDQAAKAAEVAKLDLRSAMVGEFPELQGVMGRYYAQAAGLPDAVADAARDHWRPKGEGDSVPTEPVSVAVALTEKLDTLGGFWGNDEKPTGSKDPFALRRAVLGVIRLILDNRLSVSLSDLLASAISANPPIEENVTDQTISVTFSRFEAQTHAHMRHYSDRKFYWALVRIVEDAEHPLSSSFVAPTHEGKDELAIRNDAQRCLIQAMDAAYKADPSSQEVAEVISDLGVYLVDYWRYRAKRELTTRATDLLAFFHDRLKVYLRDQGIRHDVIDACLAMPGNDDLTLLVKRATALSDVLKTEDGANLIQGFKRANNILTAEEKKDGVEYSFGADPKFAEGPEEAALFAALDQAEAKISPAMAAEDFPAAMAAMAALRGPIDAFFTAVQVNSDNAVVRRNRLNLLHRIRAVCGGVADLSRIEG